MIAIRDANGSFSSSRPPASNGIFRHHPRRLPAAVQTTCYGRRQRLVRLRRPVRIEQSISRESTLPPRGAMGDMVYAASTARSTRATRPHRM
ncbi:hypothetical protein BDV93DRAFT_612161, partial [Ceratobasidium sp. AG-I]